MSSVAVMQPTYLPWLGYLDLADQVDRFVLLDDVAFSKQSWQQRNRVKTSSGLTWLTVPVHTRGRLGRPICEVEIADSGFARKHWRTLEQAYARAPHFTSCGPGLHERYRAGDPWQSLAALNVALISWLFEAFGITTPVVLASSLAQTGKRGLRVANLCRSVGAERYVSPPGAEAYLQEDRSFFAGRGIQVVLRGVLEVAGQEAGGGGDIWACTGAQPV